MKQKRKKSIDKKHSSSFLRDNRLFFGLFIVLFSGILIIQATFAWRSYSEWVNNHMQANVEAIAVQIDEKFVPDSVLSYTQPVQKEVKVKNISNQPAIIRVRLQESLIPFLLDLTNGEDKGNGKLKTKEKGLTDKLIDPQNETTWSKDRLLAAGKTTDGKKLYYIAKDPLIMKRVFQLNDATRPEVLKQYQLNFHQEVKPADQATNNHPAWFYEEGYFYYSKVLKGGETTAIELVQSISQLTSNLDNQFKQSLYNIHVEAYGITPSLKGLQTWTTSIPLKNMYTNDPNFKLD